MFDAFSESTEVSASNEEANVVCGGGTVLLREDGRATAEA